MINITEATVLKIQNILENATVSASENVVEICQAIKYLEYLLEQHKDNVDALGKALIRFFRIRSNRFNKPDSMITDVYSILKDQDIFPSDPLTFEEQLLSDFSAFYFYKYNKKSKDPTFDIELETIENKSTDQTNILFYKTLANVEPGIKKLDEKAPFHWQPTYTYDVPIYRAIEMNDLALVTLFVTLGKYTHALDPYRGTPLDLAIAKTGVINTEIIKSLKDYHKNPSDTPQKLLFITEIKQELNQNKSELTEALQLIITKHIGVLSDFQKWYLLIGSISNGYLPLTKLLLENGAQSSDCYIRYIAARSYDIKPSPIEILKLLIEKSPSELINKIYRDGKTALELAFQNDYKEAVIELITSNKVDKTITFSNGDNAFEAATKKGWNDVCELISSMSVNTPYTPLRARLLAPGGVLNNTYNRLFGNNKTG